MIPPQFLTAIRWLNIANAAGVLIASKPALGWKRNLTSIFHSDAEVIWRGAGGEKSSSVAGNHRADRLPRTRAPSIHESWKITSGGHDDLAANSKLKRSSGNQSRGEREATPESHVSGGGSRHPGRTQETKRDTHVGPGRSSPCAFGCLECDEG